MDLGALIHKEVPCSPTSEGLMNEAPCQELSSVPGAPPSSDTTHKGEGGRPGAGHRQSVRNPDRLGRVQDDQGRLLAGAHVWHSNVGGGPVIGLSLLTQHLSMPLMPSSPKTLLE